MTLVALRSKRDHYLRSTSSPLPGRNSSQRRASLIHGGVRRPDPDYDEGMRMLRALVVMARVKRILRERAKKDGR